MRSEKIFQTEIKQAFDFYVEKNQKNKNIFYYKPPDLGLKNPFDCFLVYQDTLCCCELKFCTTGKALNRNKSINFKALFGYGKQYHQIDNLLKIERCKHKAFTLINVFIGQNESYVYALDAKLTNYCYQHGIISIKWIEKNAIQIFKTKTQNKESKLVNKNLWDLSLILD